MRAAIFNGPGEIDVEERPRPEIEAPTDAIIRVTHTAVCGSDLWFYRGDSDRDAGSPVGHEPMGIVEEVGDGVNHVRPGDRVFAPTPTNSCPTCCRAPSTRRRSSRRRSISTASRRATRRWTSERRSRSWYISTTNVTYPCQLAEYVQQERDS